MNDDTRTRAETEMRAFAEIRDKTQPSRQLTTSELQMQVRFLALHGEHLAGLLAATPTQAGVRLPWWQQNPDQEQVVEPGPGDLVLEPDPMEVNAAEAVEVRDLLKSTDIYDEHASTAGMVAALIERCETLETDRAHLKGRCEILNGIGVGHEENATKLGMVIRDVLNAAYPDRDPNALWSLNSPGVRNLANAVASWRMRTESAQLAEQELAALKRELRTLSE